MTMRIPLSVPSVGPAERLAVSDAVDGGWIAPAGPELRRFEADLAARTGRARAVAVSSGTAALHLQLLAAGIGPGDRVLCPTLTYVATLNAVSYLGATPVLVDCDEGGTMAPDLVEAAFAAPERVGGPIAAVLPVDLYGKVADHDRLGALASRHGATLLVDAAESLGSRADGRPAGSQGRAAALSFNGNKIVTASAGGAVVTDDEELAERVLFLATQAREDAAHYLHREHGYNYRLSNILAALGRAQLGRLDEFLAARRAHRERYRALCARLPGVRILSGEDDAGDNCWLTVLVLDVDPAELAEALGAQGIETRRLFTPLHRQPLCADVRRVPRLVDGTAERLFDAALAVPSSPASSPEDVEEVCARIEAFVTGCRTRIRDGALGA
ncbi:DegT/DnrJ/EryC1/StrS family aminotransferase [Nesterenkonia halobia]|uniref:Aminotransferase class I/II-fold pyridoxal phosphate-dependent enzyme n=1 Tax=Nesterenkonia halobia TaxID=37922 RepID=A0ABP6RH71_9MICC